MKCVKKFIRLLPIIYLLFLFLIFIFNDGVFTLFTNAEIDGLGSFIDIFTIDSGAWDYFVDTFLSMCGPLQPISDWIYDNITTSYFVYGFAVPILCYELWCSLLFLMFDVFNWFLSLGRNLLKKGGKYDD